MDPIAEKLTMAIFALCFLLVAMVVRAVSGPTIITETHITSFTEQKSCDDNCIMAYSLFTGKSDNELAWMYQQLDRQVLVDRVCSEGMCGGCPLCYDNGRGETNAPN